MCYKRRTGAMRREKRGRGSVMIRELTRNGTLYTFQDLFQGLLHHFSTTLALFHHFFNLFQGLRKPNDFSSSCF